MTHRQCPIPFTDAQRGTCRWCGEIIPGADGQPAKRRRWHTECAETYFLHSSLVSQRRFLIARDGPNCKLCSVTIMRPHPNAQYRDHRRTDEGWLYMDLRWVPIAGEVDHVKPLWALIGMSREQLVWFFGPENLQLICRQCHAGKTKTEAGRRAHHKRLRTVEKKKSSTMKSRGFDKTLTRRFDGTITRRIK